MRTADLLKSHAVKFNCFRLLARWVRKSFHKVSCFVSGSSITATTASYHNLPPFPFSSVWRRDLAASAARVRALKTVISPSSSFIGKSCIDRDCCEASWNCNLLIYNLIPLQCPFSFLCLVRLPIVPYVLPHSVHTFRGTKL